MFLPLFAESERAASTGLDFLKVQLASQFYTVAWPLDRHLPISNQRVQLLSNLDDAIGKLPRDSVVVFNATGSLRHDLALEVIAYLNHRREPLRTGGLRLVLCWPTVLKEELLSAAADLWSVRAASPWVDEADLAPFLALHSASDLAVNKRIIALPSQAKAAQLARWQHFHDLSAADLSPRDAVELASLQYFAASWASAAELAEAVFFALSANKNLHTDQETLIEALNLLATARSQLGNLMGALQASTRAVAAARQLAKTNPAAYGPDLAVSITNLAILLGRTGDRSGALAAAQESVSIYRGLAKTDPLLYSIDLAASFGNLSNRLSATGDFRSGLEAAIEAVEIYRLWAKTDRSAFEPELATGLINLSTSLSETGDHSGALAACREAVDLCRRLAQTKPEIYAPKLATSLGNLASIVGATRDSGGALIAASEAADIMRGLAKSNPAVYEPDLARCLSNRAVFQSQTGDLLGAGQTTLEAADIRRRLALNNPSAYEPDLAASMSNLANRLSEAGDPPGALKAAIEAVALFEKANQQTPGAFAQQLATAKRVLEGLG